MDAVGNVSQPVAIAVNTDLAIVTAVQAEPLTNSIRITFNRPDLSNLDQPSSYRVRRSGISGNSCRGRPAKRRARIQFSSGCDLSSGRVVWAARNPWRRHDRRPGWRLQRGGRRRFRDDRCGEFDRRRASAVCAWRATVPQAVSISPPRCIPSSSSTCPINSRRPPNSFRCAGVRARMGNSTTAR